MEGIHGLTDVTGFGLLGHALEMARGSGLTVEIDAHSIPLLPGVEALAREGVRTGAAARNWESYGDAVRAPAGLPDWRRDILADPQTSGGLLIAVDPQVADQVLTLARSRGFREATVIGRMTDGPPVIEIRANALDRHG